jgi:ubiquinone/menaquinone biosynthesis C-methylase UbiE
MKSRSNTAIFSSQRWACPVLLLTAIGLAGLLGCEQRTPGVEGYAYRQQSATDSTATGRIYFGREIAAATPHLGGAEWLDWPTRENTELPDRLVGNMDLRPSDVVADIGAGSGYLTFRIAERVPSGRVLAVDIQQEMLDEIEIRRDSLGIRNVETVLGSDRSPNLADESVDVAIMVAAYHEFYYPWEMMNGILGALRPGGKVVLVEYRGEDPTIDVSSHHRLTEAQARMEMEAVGLVFRYSRDILPQQHFMVFEKPFRGS